MTGTGGEIDDVNVFRSFPGIPITRDDVEIYRGRLRRELIAMRCCTCGRRHLPARSLCPECWSNDIRPERLSGAGTVALRIVLHHGPPDDAIDYQAGHCVVAVEVDEQEGLRVTGSVPSEHWAAVAIGTRVRLEWTERNGVPAPVFVPGDSA